MISFSSERNCPRAIHLLPKLMQDELGQGFFKQVNATTILGNSEHFLQMSKFKYYFRPERTNYSSPAATPWGNIHELVNKRPARATKRPMNCPFRAPELPIPYFQPKVLPWARVSRAFSAEEFMP